MSSLFRPCPVRKITGDLALLCLRAEARPVALMSFIGARLLHVRSFKDVSLLAMQETTGQYVAVSKC